MSGVDDTRGGGNVASITTYKGKDGSTFKVAKTDNGALYKLDGASSQKVDGITASSLGGGVKDSGNINPDMHPSKGRQERTTNNSTVDPTTAVAGVAVVGPYGHTYSHGFS